MICVFAGSRIVQVLELVCISLMQAALAVAVAYCVQQVFDRMLASRADIDPYFAAAITTLLVGSLVAIAILEVRRLTTAERLSLGYIATLRTAMFTRIMNAAPSVIHRRRESGLLLPFLGDLTAIKKWVGDGLVRAISATVTLTLLLSALYLLSQAPSDRRCDRSRDRDLCRVSVQRPPDARHSASAQPAGRDRELCI
ncbi:MAG: hypothetical protein IPL62_08590 [Caulobacteraceae bacterium]|nr:hypothetical protein [Caulobacteraceae bacterium]